VLTFRRHKALKVTAELASARDRLELMATENLSVAAAFDLSYADLTENQQRLFRRLGLHPGTDIDGYAAAALDGTGLSAARQRRNVIVSTTADSPATVTSQPEPTAEIPWATPVSHGVRARAKSLSTAELT
jgi:hypothetical protein